MRAHVGARNLLIIAFGSSQAREWVDHGWIRVECGRPPMSFSGPDAVDTTIVGAGKGVALDDKHTRPFQFEELQNGVCWIADVT